MNKKKTIILDPSNDAFSKNYLFIYDTNLILDQELQKMLLTMAESSVGYDIKFDSVFLYCFGGDLYEFDLANKIYSHVGDSSEVVQRLVVDARRIIDAKYAE